MPPGGSSLLACFGGCFLQGGGGANTQRGSKGTSAAARGTSSADCWQSVPDDVLQAMVSYLSPCDVALARLVCRHWRCILSCYTPALSIPTSFLAAKSAKAVLRSTAAYFPSLTSINLHHTGGWCDPVQARMDVEPLVRQERRNVSLEPLAAAFSSLQRLAVSDASFTRDPWSLQQLAWLPKLCSVSLAWDTGLWAPGQVLLEADALQPVFTLTQLTALHLDKHALLFLGEVPLGDAALSAAAQLRALVSLELSTVSASDQGVSALAALTALTRLSLRGQLAVSLGVLAKVLGSTTNLQELCLHGLLPCTGDLKCIAVAYCGKQHGQHSSSSTTTTTTTSSSSRRLRRHHGSRHHCPSSSSSASPSTSLGSSFGSGSLGSSHKSSHARSLQLQQGLEQQRGSGGSWRSSRLWQQQELHSRDAATATSTSSRVQGLSSPVQAAAPGSSSATSSPESSSSGGSMSRGGARSSGRFRSSDWTVVLLPLRRLRQLDLQSDMVFLGSCAALRSMGHVTDIRFHGAAKFLQHGAHLQPHAALPPSWLTSLAREASAAAVAQHSGSSGGGSVRMLRAGGAWPGLVSLQVDNLQLADGFIQGVAQLANLRTLVVSGPCLLAAQQLQLQQQQQQQGMGPFGSHQQQHQHQHLLQQQQQSASAPGWSSAFTADGAAVGSPLPDLSGLSDEGWGKPKALQEWATHKPADPAAVLQAALASLKLEPDSSTSSSTTTHSSTSTNSSGGSQASVPLMHASGMRPQVQQQPMLAALAALQQQQQPARPVFRPVLDADVLTRLSPLSQLSKFELHLQQQLPCGLSMTPFALAHLSVSWTGLTSLSLNVPAPGLAAAAAGADTVLQTAAGQLFASLGSLSPSLRHLSLLLTDCDPPGASGTLGLPGAVLPSTPEQPLNSGPHLDSGEGLSSGGYVVAGASAVAALPWHLLPSGLESLSLSGFAGLKADNIKAVAEAAPQLRHLRLMYCQVPPAALWVLHRVMPLLTSLVVKEDALGGLGSSGVAAVAILEHLVSLAVTLEQGADVAVLGQLGNLRYLLLDGRSNTDIRGIKGLMQLARLKALVLPLLHLHHTNHTLLMTLQLALPHTHIMNVSGNLQQHHGCQWFKCFSAADRDWWRPPRQPWAWHPTLQVLP